MHASMAQQAAFLPGTSMPPPAPALPAPGAPPRPPLTAPAMPSMAPLLAPPSQLSASSAFVPPAAQPLSPRLAPAPTLAPGPTPTTPPPAPPVDVAPPLLAAPPEGMILPVLPAAAPTPPAPVADPSVPEPARLAAALDAAGAPVVKPTLNPSRRATQA